MSEVMKPDPIAWVYQNANTEHQYLVWHKQEGGRNWTPLFTLQDVQDAILAEREACAKVCDVLAVHPEYASDITKVAAQAIRARGQA
jgi:hypothetical protein